MWVRRCLVKLADLGKVLPQYLHPYRSILPFEVDFCCCCCLCFSKCCLRWGDRMALRVFCTCSMVGDEGGGLVGGWYASWLWLAAIKSCWWPDWSSSSSTSWSSLSSISMSSSSSSSGSLLLGSLITFLFSSSFLESMRRSSGCSSRPFSLMLLLFRKLVSGDVVAAASCLSLCCSLNVRRKWLICAISAGECIARLPTGSPVVTVVAPGIRICGGGGGKIKPEVAGATTNPGWIGCSILTCCDMFLENKMLKLANCGFF